MKVNGLGSRHAPRAVARHGERAGYSSRMALAEAGLYNLGVPYPTGSRLVSQRKYSVMPKVLFIKGKDKQEVEVPEGTVLRDAALKAGIQVNYFPLELGNGFIGRYLNCHGLGHCGTCKVLVKKGMENLSPKKMKPEEFQKHRENIEKGQEKPGELKTFTERFTLWRMFSSIGHEEEMRLSCQVAVHGDCTIEVHPTFNWDGDNFWQKPYPNK
jgi:ferredoxin